MRQHETIPFECILSWCLPKEKEIYEARWINVDHSPDTNTESLLKHPFSPQLFDSASHVLHIIRMPFTVYCSPLFVLFFFFCIDYSKSIQYINIFFYIYALFCCRQKLWWTCHPTLSSLFLFVLFVSYQIRYWITVFTTRKTRNAKLFAIKKLLGVSIFNIESNLCSRKDAKYSMRSTTKSVTKKTWTNTFPKIGNVIYVTNQWVGGGHRLYRTKGFYCFWELKES